MARPENRGPREQEALAQVGSLHPQLHGALARSSSFAALLRSPSGALEAAEHLREGITQARPSGLPEVQGVAATLSHDKDAVIAALTLPYSHGQTAGCITKRKLLKRSLYGRAKLDLLRARVLSAGS